MTLWAHPAPGYFFQVWLDGVLDNPRTVTVRSNTNLFAVFAPGQGAQPEITEPPQPITVDAGDPVCFKVTATGSSPLEYQWQFNGTNLAGATSRKLALPLVTAADAGTYTVIVSNAVGTATALVDLTVVPCFALGKPQAGRDEFEEATILNTVVGPAGQTFTLEQTGDFNAWETVATQFATNGVITIETPAPAQRQWFRARKEP